MRGGAQRIAANAGNVRMQQIHRNDRGVVVRSDARFSRTAAGTEF